MIKLDTTYYRPPAAEDWQGRRDGHTEEHLRWHQHIQLVDLTQDATPFKGAFVVLGFACDEGVRRNMGRVGAMQGPKSIRKALANMPIFRSNSFSLFDAGNIICPNENLDAAQATLGKAIQRVRKKGGFPIVLGGGHEVTYGHYLGFQDDANKKLGIINFDAHFDCRAPQHHEASSGTGFFQIAEVESAKGNRLHYLPIGIQRISNTQALFDYIQAQGVTWIEGADFHTANQQQISETITRFLAEIDQLYLTIDLDVFAAAFAPGVSAVAFNGIFPDSFFWQVFRELVQSPKLKSLDIAELNPLYDIDMHTAKLAANLIFELVAKKMLDPN